MFQTLLGALMAFVGLSLHGAAGRKFYDENLGSSDLRDFIGSCLQILAVTTSIALVVLFFFKSQFAYWLGLEPKWILFGALTTTASTITLIRLTQWQVRKKAKYYGLLQISRSLINVSLSIILVVVLFYGPSGRISAQVFTFSLFSIIALALLKKDNLLCFFVWRPRFVKEALRFGVPLIPHVAGMFLLTTIDRFVIKEELGLSEVGIYVVAVQFGMALRLIFDAINKAYMPWLFERLKRDNEEEKKQIVRYTYGWFALILFGAGLSFLVVPWLVIFVAGDEYKRAGEVVGWLVLGQVFHGMYLMVTNYIFFSKRTGFLSLATIFSGTVNVLLLIILVDYLGMKGAAYAFCFSMGIRFILSWYVAQKRHAMPWFNIKAHS